jgi:hypothetical protein
MRWRNGRRHVLAAGLALAAISLFAQPARAQWDFGLRTGYYTDAEELFLGAELLTRVSDSAWWFNPNVEFVFVDPGDLWTLNLDFHYDFDTRDNDTYFWAGGGPAVVFRDPGGPRDDDTELGLNLLAGVGWRLESAVPYLQGKIIISDDSEAVIAIGVRF